MREMTLEISPSNKDLCLWQFLPVKREMDLLVAWEGMEARVRRALQLAISFIFDSATASSSAIRLSHLLSVTPQDILDGRNVGLLTAERALEVVAGISCDLSPVRAIPLNEPLIGTCHEILSGQFQERHLTAGSMESNQESFEPEFSIDEELPIYASKPELKISWSRVPDPTRATLSKALIEIGKGEVSEAKQFCINDLRGVSHQILSTLSSVGISKIGKLIADLQDLQVAVENNPEFDIELADLHSIEAINKAETISELTEALLRRARLDFDLDERQTLVVQERAPWASNTPKSLQEIGDEIGVSRERVRQIFKVAEGFKLSLPEPPSLLIDIHNQLLEVANFPEFLESLVIEGISRDQKLTIARVKALGEVCNYPALVFDLEQAVYEWHRPQ